MLDDRALGKPISRRQSEQNVDQIGHRPSERPVGAQVLPESYQHEREEESVPVYAGHVRSSVFRIATTELMSLASPRGLIGRVGGSL